jgi:hypothetical protein
MVMGRGSVLQRRVGGRVNPWGGAELGPGKKTLEVRVPKSTGFTLITPPFAEGFVASGTLRR